jgi:hypothetical protein
MDPILQQLVVLFKYHDGSLLVHLNTISTTIMNQFLFLHKWKYGVKGFFLNITMVLCWPFKYH